MTKFISDTWDNGNHLTRFKEVIRVCETCNGEGITDDEECKECDGEGDIVYNE